MIIETRKNTPLNPNPGWYNGVDPISPAHEQPPKAIITPENLAHFQALVEAKYKRLAYNAAYQRDLRTIKRQGLNMTVKEWREKNDNR